MKVAFLSGSFYSDEFSHANNVDAYIVRDGEVIESGQLIRRFEKDWIVDNPIPREMSPVHTAGYMVRLIALDALSVFRSDCDIQHPKVFKDAANVSDEMTLYRVIR